LELLLGILRPFPVPDSSAEGPPFRRLPAPDPVFAYPFAYRPGCDEKAGKYRLMSGRRVGRQAQVRADVSSPMDQSDESTFSQGKSSNSLR
jgi:hypothetical protein